MTEKLHSRCLHKPRLNSTLISHFVTFKGFVHNYCSLSSGRDKHAYVYGRVHANAGSHKEVASGGSKPRRRARLDTLKVALDRQHAPRPSCSIGSADHTSAFQSFSHPAMHQMPPTNPSAAPLHAHRAGRSQPSSHQTAQAGVAPRGSVPEHASDATMNGGQRGGACHTDTQQENAAQSPQIGVQETAQIGFQAAAQNHIGAGSGAIASSSASAVESLEAPGDDAVLAKFKDMEGDAWKVFYLASKMGLRSGVIERAAVRLRTLQKND